jgi:hypothetical protein
MRRDLHDDYGEDLSSRSLRKFNTLPDAKLREVIARDGYLILH